MNKEMLLNETELEAVSGGLQNLALGSAGLIIDASLNNVGNVAIDLKVDASTKIADSFNTSNVLGRLFPF